MNNDLISRDALLEGFQFRLPIDSERREVIARCVEIARGLINDAPAVDAPKWISVEDKFPEDVLADKDTKVIHCLVALEPPRSQPNRKPLVTKAQRQWNSWIKRWEWGRVSGVIYWMPLPEPPKEG